MRSNFLISTFNQIFSNEIFIRRNQTAANAKPFPTRRPRLMCVLAHPDDEALCVGGTLSRYAADGVDITLVMATRGERGWRGDAASDPGLKRLGQIREAELRAAARVLGVREIVFLDYLDGQVNDAEPSELVARITHEIRRFRPNVVITFDPHGMYGHPDHITISEATTNAVFCAADAEYEISRILVPHRVKKLYYRVYTQRALAAYQDVFGELRMNVADVERAATPWQDWAISTQVDTAAYANVVWEAIACHRTQLVADEAMRRQFFAHQRGELGNESYYRVFSIVNNGRQRETDLMEGLVTMMNGMKWYLSP
jgi:LmbE family N-acetylglucosaminyl deacetylase